MNPKTYIKYELQNSGDNGKSWYRRAVKRTDDLREAETHFREVVRVERKSNAEMRWILPGELCHDAKHYRVVRCDCTVINPEFRP